MVKNLNKENAIEFTAVLMHANFPTVDGNIYPMCVLEKLVERFSMKPSATIEELNLVERKLKNIPISEPWPRRTMADIIFSEIHDNSLFITGRCKSTRDGKLLVSIIESYGLVNIDFFPVGYGIAGQDGIIQPDYRLSYISFDVKNKGVNKIR